MLPLVYHDKYSFSFDQGHRFVMSKFHLLYEYLQNRSMISNNLFNSPGARLEDLSIAHEEAYLENLNAGTVEPKAWRRVGLPWSRSLIERSFISPSGTLLAARLALKYGVAAHLAGGTHHAHYGFGSGFCLVNDLAYTALELLDKGEVEKVLIFDLDVHQGDGTAAILKDEPRAFTCSIHCEKNFPFQKQQSDLDIGLEVGLGDSAYLEIVEKNLTDLLENFKPSIVLYDAGVDVWQGDGLGRLSLSLDGIKARDELVLKHCLQRDIPVATVIGGGYDEDHHRLAQRHAIVVEQAASVLAGLG